MLESDAKGYYSYLPAIFIYQDLNFTFFDNIEKSKYYNKDLYYDYRAKYNTKSINKYYCGTAIVQSSFFLVAHFLSYCFDYEMDGYSKLYIISINIAAIFYLLIALLYLNSLLKLFKISFSNRIITIYSAVFATNIFYYTVGESGMSHIYSLAFITMFLYYSKQYFNDFNIKTIYKIALILGIIVLIRPINFLIILSLPFLSNNFKILKIGFSLLINYRKNTLISLIIFISIISIQLIIYKISTGHFFVYSYQDEVFDFYSPHMLDILFSYKKGLFLYTPILFISLIGLFPLWKISKFNFLTLILFLYFITYIFSSWPVWYYGGSFSSRVYLEYVPLFMILFALSLENIKSIFYNNTYKLISIILILVCQIQTFQYRYYYIHNSEMTKEKYWEVFLRVDLLF